MMLHGGVHTLNYLTIAGGGKANSQGVNSSLYVDKPADITAQGANIKEMELSSVPTGVGLIPGGERIYVSQEHPDGRITFIDAVSDEPITVTGFELNGQID